MMIPANFLAASSGVSLYLAATERVGCGDSDITIRFTFLVTPLLSVYFFSENTLKINLCLGAGCSSCKYIYLNISLCLRIRRTARVNSMKDNLCLFLHSIQHICKIWWQLLEPLRHQSIRNKKTHFHINISQDLQIDVFKDHSNS